MKKIAFIPARYAASRFPAKLMQPLADKTVILYTYENILNMNLFDEIIVVTDSDIIFNEISQHGGKAIMSKKNHESGSDRIAEAATEIDVDIIVNIQGDEPFVQKQSLQNLLDVFEKDKEKKVQVASLMHEIKIEESIQNTNNVKVVVDKNLNALYFSRSAIPFNRGNENLVTYYKHIGIYAYRKQALIHFTEWQQTPLEQAEKLEQLRYLENGINIKMVLTKETSIGIDTPGDLEEANKFLQMK